MTTLRDDALTVREVLETPDAARLMWMSAWRLMRRGESVRRTLELLATHHSVRPRHVTRTLRVAAEGATWPSRNRMSLKGDAR